MPAFESPYATPVGPGPIWWRKLRWSFKSIRRPYKMEFPVPVPVEEAEAWADNYLHKGDTWYIDTMALQGEIHDQRAQTEVLLANATAEARMLEQCELDRRRAIDAVGMARQSPTEIIILLNAIDHLIDVEADFREKFPWESQQNCYDDDCRTSGVCQDPQRCYR